MGVVEGRGACFEGVGVACPLHMLEWFGMGSIPARSNGMHEIWEGVCVRREGRYFLKKNCDAFLKLFLFYCDELFSI